MLRFGNLYALLPAPSPFGGISAYKNSGLRRVSKRKVLYYFLHQGVLLEKGGGGHPHPALTLPFITGRDFQEDEATGEEDPQERKGSQGC